MADVDELSWLQDWYLSQCDGNWEHTYGMKIKTLDNPGWAVEIDLSNTNLAGWTHEELNTDLGDNDWIVCRIRNEKFQGFGDAMKFKTILRTFRKWVETASSTA